MLVVHSETVVDRFGAHEDAAQHNWSVALQTYHTALSAYRRVLEAKARRERRRGSVIPPLPVIALPSKPVVTADLHELTRREREVAELIARGYSNQQIADALVLTRGTVANHVAHILSKVGATNRTQLAARVFLSTTAVPTSNGSRRL